jgi:DNA-binding MarR family transcriptional regulator
MENRFENFTITILKLSKLIRKIKLCEMEEYELKAVHVMCIYYAGCREHGVTAAELSQLTSEDKAAISRALAYLYERGYIAYDDKKYNSMITLTKEGSVLFESIQQKAENAVKAGGGFMSSDEIEILYSLLGKITHNLENYYDQLSGK